MKILSYYDLVQKENGTSVQKGMNHDIKPGYAIVLMSTKENSPANKKDYFNKHFDGEILETVNNNVDFYQKLEKNPDLRKFIQEFFFRSYNKKKAV